MENYKGISIHIGIDKNPDYFKGKPELSGCVNDAKFMANLAESNGFEKVINVNTSNEANTYSPTYDNVEAIIGYAKENLSPDGILLITYSGHGGQTYDPSITYDPPSFMEKDGKNEFWALLEKKMLDDKIIELLTRFEETQRIIIISDSCNSGTMIDNYEEALRSYFAELEPEVKNEINVESSINAVLDSIGFEVEDISPVSQADDISKLNNVLGEGWEDEALPNYKTPPRESFGSIAEDNDLITQKLEVVSETDDKEKNIKDKLKASVLLISACKSWQLAEEAPEKDVIDGKPHGLFTKCLMDVLNENNYISVEDKHITYNGSGNPLNYLQLHEAIWKKLRGTLQNPNYLKIGIPNAAFEMQNCFTI